MYKYSIATRDHICTICFKLTLTKVSWSFRTCGTHSSLRANRSLASVVARRSDRTRHLTNVLYLRRENNTSNRNPPFSLFFFLVKDSSTNGKCKLSMNKEPCLLYTYRDLRAKKHRDKNSIFELEEPSDWSYDFLSLVKNDVSTLWLAISLFSLVNKTVSLAHRSSWLTNSTFPRA